jgi:hypothetical protein
VALELGHVQEYEGEREDLAPATVVEEAVGKVVAIVNIEFIVNATDLSSRRIPPRR